MAHTIIISLSSVTIIVFDPMEKHYGSSYMRDHRNEKETFKRGLRTEEVKQNIGYRDASPYKKNMEIMTKFPGW